MLTNARLAQGTERKQGKGAGGGERAVIVGSQQNTKGGMICQNDGKGRPRRERVREAGRKGGRRPCKSTPGLPGRIKKR